MKYFRGKKILLTGATGGFGSEFTRRLLALGAEIILTDINQAGLEKMSSETGSSDPGQGKISGIKASDLSTYEGCRELWSYCRENFGGIDILINNAGMLTYGYFHEHPDNMIEKLIEVNLLAPMRLSRLFLPEMIDRKSGHIVFISSLAAVVPTAFETSYTASKSGIRGFGTALASEVNGYGIAVTNVYPNFSDTGMLRSLSYGSAKVRKPASLLIDSPDTVISAALRGISKKKLHLYPGLLTKLIHLWAKVVPMVYSLPVDIRK